MFALMFELGLPRAHKLDKISGSQWHILLYDNFLFLDTKNQAYLEN